MCPCDLCEELAKRFKVFYNRINGTKLEGIIPFSIDYTAVYTGIPRPTYIPGNRSEPPIKALHFHVVCYQAYVLYFFGEGFRPAIYRAYARLLL